MKTWKKTHAYATMRAVFGAALVVAVLAGCTFFDRTGTVNLNLTDAPVDAENIKGVYISITKIEVNNNGDWKEFAVYDEPREFDLLQLQGGETELLGTVQLPAGRDNQIRLYLDGPTEGQGQPSNPGCYILYQDDSTAPLFVPSGAQSGVKIVGSFEVPVNGEITVTADFDVRKAVVQRGGTGSYILKPANSIRLVVDNQAGRITATVAGVTGYDASDVHVYAYADGTYSADETTASSTDSPLFPNAVTSSALNENGEYVLAFLAEGTYDLVVAGFSGGSFVEVLGREDNVSVVSEENTTVAIDLTQ
jgi:hypothetical protein